MPALRVTLTDANRAAINLTNATAVVFSMENLDGLAFKIALAASAFIDKANGIVEYQWVAADTVIGNVGFWIGQFHLTWSTGVQSVPVPRPIHVEIQRRIAA